MKILAIDSSGMTASVAVWEDNLISAEYTVNHKKTHSQTLLPMLEEISRMIELDLNTVDAVAVAAGPGSFTGLRIGSATAKGLAEALNKPIVSVPTVDGLAGNLYGTDKLICPIMDARRNQTYTGLYEFVKNNEETEEKEFQLHSIANQRAVDIGEIIELINENDREVIFLGDGVPVFKDTISEKIRVPYSFAPASCNRQRAAVIAHLAADLYRKGQYEEAAEHAPEYLRLSQAERERNEAMKA